MKSPNYRTFFAALCLCAFPFSGLAAAAGATSALPSLPYPSIYALAKGGDSANLRACKAQCRKDYRRCYSQGNQVGKPKVTGGQTCSEQKVMCLRACQRQ